MKTCKRDPSWSSWAKYKAVDADGGAWELMMTGALIFYNENYKGDWKKSLRKIED